MTTCVSGRPPVSLRLSHGCDVLLLLVLFSCSRSLHPTPRSLSSARNRLNVPSYVLLLHMLHLAPESVAAADFDRLLNSIWSIAFELELASAAIVGKCSGCYSRRTMSSIPQGIYAASKVHLNMDSGEDLWRRRSTTFMERKVNSHGGEKSTSWPTFPKMNQQFMDHPLAKYNSKMMNSIWGLYNRYSVHNFKRVTEEDVKGRAGEWMAPNSFAFNNKAQQPTPAASGVGAAPALPNPSVPMRDPNPLNTFWIGGHAH